MKKALRLLLYFLFGIVGLIIVFLCFVEFTGIPRYEPRPPQLKVEITQARIDRGKKLAEILCRDCHYNPATNRLSGINMLAPSQFGVAYSRNITQDPYYGIGSWTDGDIAYLLRTGIKKDGGYAPPWMVKEPLMSDEDIYSIISYLHSSDEWVQPVAVADTESKPSLLAKILCHTIFKPFPYPDHPIPVPDSTDRVAVGRYITVVAADCYNCHSADFKTNDPLNPEKSKGFLGGGNELNQHDGSDIYSANITTDKETGIGSWTEDQFIQAVRFGFIPNGKTVRYPMVPRPMLDSLEVDAIWKYLQTVPKIHNAVQQVAYK
jgi:mono/diheme cytochrome c family protein